MSRSSCPRVIAPACLNGIGSRRSGGALALLGSGPLRHSRVAPWLDSHMNMGEQKTNTNAPASTGTARLGPVGGPDDQGFTHAGGRTDRQITIASEDGAVIYSKRTADTPKAADAHIVAAGYRRTSDWASGVAAVEKIPASVRARKLSIAAVVAVVVIALTAVFIGQSTNKVPNAAKDGCQQKVQTTLPSGAVPKFHEITVSEWPSRDKNWSKSWHVEGTVNTLDLLGAVRDVPFICEMYVDGGGSVHKGTVSMKW